MFKTYLSLEHIVAIGYTIFVFSLPFTFTFLRDDVVPLFNDLNYNNLFICITFDLITTDL